jgi:hypothetical protein
MYSNGEKNNVQFNGTFIFFRKTKQINDYDSYLVFLMYVDRVSFYPSISSSYSINPGFN